jgi:hypothetical protein
MQAIREMRSKNFNKALFTNEAKLWPENREKENLMIRTLMNVAKTG